MNQTQRAQLTLATLLIGMAVVNKGGLDLTAAIIVILGCTNLWMGLGAFIRHDDSKDEGSSNK
jgi:hypothetical protein